MRALPTSSYQAQEMVKGPYGLSANSGQGLSVALSSHLTITMRIAMSGPIGWNALPRMPSASTHLGWVLWLNGWTRSTTLRSRTRLGSAGTLCRLFGAASCVPFFCSTSRCHCFSHFVQAVDRWHRFGHRARLLRIPAIPSGHIAVSSLVCALSDLRLICVTSSMAHLKH